MHSGYCSAPRTIFPPAIGLAAGSDSVGAGFGGPPVHAAPSMAEIAMAASPRRTCCVFIDLLATDRDDIARPEIVRKATRPSCGGPFRSAESSRLAAGREI